MKRYILLAFLASLFFPYRAMATVTGDSSSVSFTCTGSTGPYPFTFPISEPTALSVIQNGTTLGSTAYNITPVNNNYHNGGSVGLHVACPSGQTLVLQRNTPLTQLTVFTDNMPVPMTTIGNAVDKLTEIVQDITQKVVSCPTGQFFNQLSIDGTSVCQFPTVLVPVSPTGIGNGITVIDMSKITGVDITGATSSTPGIITAITQCNASGGVLLFVPGIYTETATPPAINVNNCSVQGYGPATVLQAASGTTGISLLKFNVGNNYKNGYVRDLTVNCNSSNPTPGTGRQNNGVWMLDSLMIPFSNLWVSNCNNSFLMENATYFDERNIFSTITLSNFTNGFLMQQDSGDTFNSFDHNVWDHIHINTFSNGDSVFHLTGGASAAQCYFADINGNFGSGGGNSQYVFFLDGGSALMSPFITAMPELDSGTSYLFGAGTAALSAGVCGTIYNCVTNGYGWSSGISLEFGGTNWGTQTFVDLGNGTLSLPVPNYTGPAIVLDNPNFIAGTMGWQSAGSGGVIAQDTTSPFTNGKSMKFTIPTQFAAATTIRSYAAYPGESITMSAYMKSDGVFDAEMAVAAIDGSGTLISYPIQIGYTTSTSWAQFSETATMPANTASVFIVATRQDASGGSHSGWFTAVNVAVATTGTGFVTTSTAVSGNVAKYTSPTNLAPAAFGDIVNLWTSCTAGFLQFDGTCASSTVGNAAIKPNSLTPVCWASPFGNDSTGDGLSFGTAKKTETGCIDLLNVAGLGGTIYLSDGGTGQPVQANATSTSCGLYLGGASDPNYASFNTSGPFSCWRQLHGAINIIGVAGSGNAAFAVGQEVSVAGASNCSFTTGTYAPSLWLSNALSFTMTGIKFSNGCVALGVGSDKDATTGTDSIQNFQLDHDTWGVASTAGLGPSTIIGSNSFWGFFRNDSILGNSNEGCAVTSLTRSSNVVTAVCSGGLPASWPTTGSSNFNIGISGALNQSFNTLGINNYTYVSSTSFTYPQIGPNATSSGAYATSDAAQAVIASPSGGGGEGLIFFDDDFLGATGIRDYTNNHSAIFAYGLYQENGIAPLVHLYGCSGSNTSGSIVNSLSPADNLTNIPGARVDGCSTAQMVAQNTTVEGVASPGPMAGPSNPLQLPSAAGQPGIVGGRNYSQEDSARRAFGPAVTPNGLVNLANQSPSAWAPGGTCGGTVGTPVAAPDGTTNAGELAPGSGSQTACFYQVTTSLTAGDHLIGGAWVQSVDANGYASNVTVNVNSNVAIFNGVGTVNASRQWGGGGEWEWDWFVAPITSTGSFHYSFVGSASSTNPASFFAPVLLYVPAGTKTKNEVYEMALRLQSFRSDATAAQVSLLPGEQFKADSAQIGNLTQLTTEGDMLYEHSSLMARLGVGASGQCLTSNGTDPLWGSCATGGTVTTSTAVAGNIPKYTSATNLAPAAFGDIVGLWTSCSVGFLKFDGTCVNPSGSGTVTVSGGGNLSNGAIVTGASTQVAQTPSATTTLDSSGDFATPGTSCQGGPTPYIDPRCPPYNCFEDDSHDDTACMNAAIDAMNASTSSHKIYLSGFPIVNPPLHPITTRGFVLEGCHAGRPGSANGGGCGVDAKYPTSAPSTLLPLFSIGNPKAIALLTLSRNSGTSQVTATFTTPPAGSGTFEPVGKINIAGAADSSFNGGPFTINTANYGTNTIVWGQSGSSSSTTGGTGTAPLHDTSPGYDGVYEAEFRNIKLRCVSGTTLLDNGINHYCGNVAAVAVYRGGDVRFTEFKTESFNYGIWGDQMQTATIYDYESTYDHHGVELNPESDQIHFTGTYYCLYDDTCIWGSGVHGLKVDYLNTVDAGAATNNDAAVEIGDAYTTTPGDPHDNDNASTHVDFDIVWAEHSGTTGGIFGDIFQFGEYNGTPNITQFSNEYNTGLLIHDMHFKTRPQSSSTYTVYPVTVGNADYVFLDTPRNAYLGVSPTGAFASWFNFVGSTSPEHVKILQFDTGTVKATVPPTLFNNSGTGLPKPYYVLGDGSSQTKIFTTSSISLNDGYNSSVFINQNATAGQAITATLPLLPTSSDRVGMKKCILNGNVSGVLNTGAITVSAASGNFIDWSGGRTSSGGFMTSAPGGAGDWAFLVGISETDWLFTPTLGTWAP